MSDAVAQAMAECARRPRSGLRIITTASRARGGSEEKPGTVFIALPSGNQRLWKALFPADRQRSRSSSPSRTRFLLRFSRKTRSSRRADLHLW